MVMMIMNSITNSRAKSLEKSQTPDFFLAACNGVFKYLAKHFVGVSWNDIFALPKIRGYRGIAWNLGEKEVH